MRQRQEQRIALTPRLVTNSVDAALGHALQGGRLCLALAYQCLDAVRAGELRVVLADHEPRALPIHLVYPTNRLLSAKIRALVAACAGQLAQARADYAARTTQERAEHARIVFTAHSIPQAIAATCAYEADLRQTAKSGWGANPVRACLRADLPPSCVRHRAAHTRPVAEGPDRDRTGAYRATVLARLFARRASSKSAAKAHQPLPALRLALTVQPSPPSELPARPSTPASRVEGVLAELVEASALSSGCASTGPASTSPASPWPASHTISIGAVAGG